MKWVAIISLLNCDAAYPYLCCSFCPGVTDQVEQVTEFHDKARCDAFAHEWAIGKTFSEKRLYGGFCEAR